MGRKYKPGSYARELDQWFQLIRKQLETNFTPGILKQAGNDLLKGMNIYHVSRTYGIPLGWVESIPLTIRIECPQCARVLTVDYDRTLDINFVHLRCEIHGIVVHSPCVQDGVVHKPRAKRAKVGIVS